MLKLSFILLNFIEASRDCLDGVNQYSGRVSITKSGRTCMRWDQEYPHQPKYRPRYNDQHNHCRSPDGDKTPWCYTTDTKKRFEYCNISKCSLPTDCWSVNGYGGSVSSTKDGFTCQRWDSDYPHHIGPTRRLANSTHNFCDGRVALDDPRGPWCYTTNRLRQFDYCDIPKCGAPVIQAGYEIPTTTTTSTTTTYTTTTLTTASITTTTIALTQFGLTASDATTTTTNAQPIAKCGHSNSLLDPDRIGSRNISILNQFGAIQTDDYAARILFGDNATYGLFPWQVKLHGPEGCGGTLIRNNVVVTAAHCLRYKTGYQYRANEWKVSAGHITASGYDDPRFKYGDNMRKVKKVIVHKDYNRYTNENDIGLLILKRPFEVSTNIGLACLPAPQFEPAGGAQCIISGWGTKEDGRYAKTLKWTVIPVVSDKECRNRLPAGWLHTPMMCAGGSTVPGRRVADTCQGDSGGPLICLINDSATLIGVTSFGKGCGGSTPGVYSDVGELVHWIEEKANQYA